eukprot:CAMPEP_0118715286 /NCGR_PEP_ID=MMETSP0800-20121206/26779_1 /TAXON_ID=210618 ORGANISM="Striatella unipunctata, Strain CCMP2910" /NCGR_SAMPLE_ID=MMETSP0800 /ASSEMBLY_ACC=CAM_ASM_000638 /LENGTH=340 /DNA_ID=CAMNT_0006621415 /DNA_START=44 /DNA_END=1067 /DNA_ORIENTATION=-
MAPGLHESEWNLKGKYSCKSAHTRALQEGRCTCRIRQVPGDGNCLFHSIAVCLSMAVNKTQLYMDDGDGNGHNGDYYCGNNNNKNEMAQLHETSRLLRHAAVDRLERDPNKWLFLQDCEYLRAWDLVEKAALPHKLEPSEYCRLMRKDSYWGGGPEIVALCNVLKRPIHVYELKQQPAPPPPPTTTTATAQHQHQHHNGKNVFLLRRMACFGSPKYDRREALHILSADSRFPDVEPGHQLDRGDHFLALFPEPIHPKETTTTQRKKRARKKKGTIVRGGGNEDVVVCSSSSRNGKRWFFCTSSKHANDQENEEEKKKKDEYYYYETITNWQNWWDVLLDK